MSTTGGGALSFLNQGTAPSASSNTTTSSTSLPSWYTDYTAQILNTAAQFAAQPYQTYSGPRIAAQTSQTQDAYNAAPGVQASADAAAAGAQSGIQQGFDENNPLAAAQPYLNNGTNPTYNTVQSYMNPYNTDVTNAIATAANTNFNNNTLPALQSSIIGAGNITGSSTEGTNLMENAEQQNEQNINNTQAAALQSGYTGALTAAQAGAQNSLTAAGTAANANTAQANTAINAGTAASNVGTQQTANDIAAQTNENTLGQQSQGYNQSNLNLAYQDYLNQLNYPLTGISEMQGALSGIQIPSGTTTSSYGTGVNGGNGSAQGSTTSPLASLFGTGVGTAANTASPTNETGTVTTANNPTGNPFLSTTLP
jgi:hypothetical protein